MDDAWDRGGDQHETADQPRPAGLDPSVDRGPEPRPGEKWAGPPDRPATPRDAEAHPRFLPPDAPRGPEPMLDEGIEADRAAADAPRVLADGTWEWAEKDLRLDAADNARADRALETNRANEGRGADGNYTDHGLTPAMRRIDAKLEDGHLEGCPEYSLKSPDRYKEKLAKALLAEPGRDAGDLAEQIPDGIRYTFAFDPDRYTAGTRAGIAELHEHGFELQQVKNWWDNAEYKGINTRWRDPANGQLFEVQFHTPESWQAKQTTHDAYDRIGNARTPVREAERLQSYQEEVALRVPRPPDVDTIEDYKKGRT